MIYKLLLTLIFAFLYGWFIQYPLYAQPITVNEQPANITEVEQDPPPLGPACSSGSGPGGLQINPDQPTCCVSGYVYVDGKPVKDAVVTVSGPNQEKYQAATSAKNMTFDVPIDISSLDLEPRETITFTARAYTVTTLSGDVHRVEEPRLANINRAASTTEVSTPKFSHFINLLLLLDSSNLELDIDETVTINTSYIIQTLDGQEYINDVTISQKIPAPSYGMGLHDSPLDVKPGDRVTITASYKGITQADSFIAKSGTIQVDVILPNQEQTKPIATISYLSPKDLYQHETLYIGGRAADQDDSNVIQAHLWQSNGVTISNQAAFTITANALPIGAQMVQYRVQDDEGEWSDILTEQILVRESKKFYLPAIMQ